jgi:hypothetical protein
MYVFVVGEWKMPAVMPNFGRCGEASIHRGKEQHSVQDFFKQILCRISIVSLAEYAACLQVQVSLRLIGLSSVPFTNKH